MQNHLASPRTGAAPAAGRRPSGPRRLKIAATAALAASAAVAAAIRLSPEPSTALLALRAAAEAAMVGGLADWFAVTALFRRPLGLPIPHTAIVPSSKDRIGESLGAFFREHFLDPDRIAERIGAIDASGHLADWLREPANTGRLADGIADLLPRWLEGIDDAGLKAGAKAEIRRLVAGIDPAEAAYDVLTTALDRGEHLAAIDGVSRAALRWLDAERPQVAERINTMIVEGLSSHIEGFVTRTFALDPRRLLNGAVSRRLAEEITAVIMSKSAEQLAALATPGSDQRASVDEMIRLRVSALRESADWTAQIAALRARLISGPAFDERFDALWDRLRARLTAELGTSRDRVATALSDQMARLADRLAADDALRARIDEGLRRIVREAVASYRDEAAAYIAGVVKGWDPEAMARIAEANVGRDLQFIRLNGTIVGALVGCGLFLAERLPDIDWSVPLALFAP